MQSVASGIFCDIASDLAKFRWFERRIAASLIGHGEGIKYLGLRTACAPQVAAYPRQLIVAAPLWDRGILLWAGFCGRCFARPIGNEIAPGPR